jgi:drug/metabolite transporter (DMT)-like permease
LFFKIDGGLVKKGERMPVYAAVLLSMLAMSVSAPLNKLAIAGGMAPAVINFWRLGTASLCTLPLVIFSAGGRRELKQLFEKPKDMLLLAASGLFLSMHFYTWVVSLTITSTFGSVVLVSAHPVFTLIGDRVFFGQRYSKAGLAGAGLSLLGIVLVGGNSILRHEGTIAGDLLALTGALMFSGYILAGRELRSRYSINTYTTGVYGVSAVILGAISLATGLRFAPYPLQVFGYVGCIVVVSTFLGHTVVNWSLGHLPPSTVSIMLLASPLFTGVWSFILLGDKPSLYLVGGGLITVLGMAWYLAAQMQAARRKALEAHASAA